MNRSHLKAFSLATFVFTLAVFAPIARGAVLTDADYTYEDGGATLVATVGKGDEAPLDGSLITAAITKIVKRGEGVLKAETSSETALSAFTGDFVVEKGVYWYKHAYGFGAHGAATIDILDGAMIRCSGTTTGAFDNKTINFYGNPPKAQSINGTWYSMRGKTHLDGLKTSVGLNVRLVVHDTDTTFFFQGSGSNDLYGIFDLAGKTLEFESTGNGSILYLAGSVMNGGTLALDCAQIVNGRDSSTNLTFEAASAATGKVKIINDGVLNFKNGVTLSNGWTLEVAGGNARGNINKFPTNTTQPNWDGPVVFADGSSIASFSGYSQWASNTVFNVQGPVSGTGAVSVGPGWLNLFSSDATSNTFSGTVTVTGQSADQTQTYKTAPGGGGIGVWNGALCFPHAESVTFTDSARFEFMDNTPASVPTLTFAGGAGDVQTIKGGSSANRSTIAGIEKTGAGTLAIFSPAHVTGPVAVSNGVLRIPGASGLREWMLTSPDGNVVQSLQPWNIDTSRITVTDLGINEDGPYRLLSQNNWPPKAERPDKPFGYVYHGYVWNDSDSPVTMKVLHCLLPYTHIWFGSDHATSMVFSSSDPDPKEVELQPGATEVFMYAYTYGGNVQWWGDFGSPYALYYATNTTWTVAEFSAARTAYMADKTAANKKVVTDMIAEMTRFTDGGSGILLTADVSGMNARPLPVIDDLVFKNGAVLDLLHNTDYFVKNLTGSPTVVNANIFGITNNWTICAADFPAADSTVRNPMTVDGALTFAEGATFSIDDATAMAREETIVATTTGGITGVPAAADGLVGWRLAVNGNNLVLTYSKGTIFFFR